ncbi:MAG: aldo/keto reductase [Candidatus Eremiobacteraeota bacterium]|nr:aldo/keto reductase [Candidatus Eremiobacteraeota bacterium]
MDKTSIQASRVGMGTWAIGGDLWGGSDDNESIATVHSALDRGITLFDTAPGYGEGHSEEVVGRALRGRRDKAIIATKVGLEWLPSHAVVRNSTPVRIQKELDDSLRRLQTDRIDLYQIHWPDHSTPLEETAHAMQRLLDAGKIRAIGVSNFSIQEMDRFRKATPLHTCQPPLNLFERAAENDILPYAREHAMTALTYGALCRGLLSGTMTEKTTFENDALRGSFDPKFKQPRFGEYLRAVKRLDELAQKRYGKRVIQLAVRWVLDHPGGGIALWGARHPGQLAPLDGIFDFHLDADAKREIDRILAEEIKDPIGPEFMGPPERDASQTR